MQKERYREQPEEDAAPLVAEAEELIPGICSQHLSW